MAISGSLDGSFCLMQILDKDPRRKEPIPVISEITESIIPRTQRDQVIKQIDKLKTEIEIKKKAENLKLENDKAEKAETLSKLTRQLRSEEESAL